MNTLYNVIDATQSNNGANRGRGQLKLCGKLFQATGSLANALTH